VATAAFSGGRREIGRNRIMVAQASLHCNINAAKKPLRRMGVATIRLSRIAASSPRHDAGQEQPREPTLNVTFPGASRLAAGALAALASLVLGACGSGAVSAPPATVTPGPITITPSTATLFADLPATFIVTGGNGSFLVATSDQQALPAAPTFTGNTLTLVPNQVAVDTPVTLTVRDTGSTTPATAAITVKPRTVSNVVTVTPSASQSAACGAAICSGGDAEVKVVLSQGGVPLVGRTVQFDVVSGDVRIITSAAGVPEADELSGTTTTDSSGTARIRIRVDASATSQTALLRATDVSSGSSQTVSIAIAPGSNAPLNAQPSTVNFTGSTATSCASGITASVIVFGGRPPYTLSSPGAFTVTPPVLTASGSTFTIGATGQCSSASPIAIVDANGASVTVTASNALGTGVALPAFVVAPSTVTFTGCPQEASVVLAGGTGSYFASDDPSTTSNTLVTTSISGSTGTIFFNANAATHALATFPFDFQIGFSDGRVVLPVTVHVANNGGC
jgi:hypothetical protein